MRGMSKMLAFLKELRENNDRLWFAERKDYYNAVRAECIDEIERILRCASAFDPDLRGVAATDCIYRIYRDIRFSADKRPGLVGESLKSMPKGFAKDLPHADVLKMKEFLVMTPLDDEFFADDSWLDTVVGYMKLAKPFKDFLNYSLE